MTMYKFFSKNGQILPAAEAVVSVANLEYAYGFGVYENIRVRQGRALFIADHIERLMTSARAIGLEHTFKAPEIIKYCADLIDKIGATESINLKIILIGAADHKDTQLFILPLAPFFPNKKIYTAGANVITVNYERPFPHAKTLNMLPSYLAYKKAKEAGGYDALLVNRAGCITEGTRTNFFALKGKTIVGASETEILGGVTRKYVLKVAAENGYTIKEENIPLAKIEEYDSAFLTSTSSKIVPLKKINDFIFPSLSPELARLIKLFNECLDQP